MAVMVDNQKSKLDVFVWFLVIASVLAGLSGYYYFFISKPLIFRVISVLSGVLLALILSYNTSGGKIAYTYWQDALREMRKVIWPTKKETVQTTLAVLAMAFVMGLLLWSIDALLTRLIAWLINL